MAIESLRHNHTVDNDWLNPPDISECFPTSVKVVKVQGLAWTPATPLANMVCIEILLIL